MIDKLELKLHQNANELQNQNINSSNKRVNNQRSQMQKEENKYQNMVDPPIQLESPFESPKIQQIDLNDFNKELD